MVKIVCAKYPRRSKCVWDPGQNEHEKLREEGRCDPEFRGECSHSINQYYIVTGTSTVLRWEISKRRASTLECGRAAENPLEAQGDHIIGRSILPSRLQKFPCSFRSAVFTRKLLYYREVDANYIKFKRSLMAKGFVRNVAASSLRSSGTQAKVREATSNDPYEEPSGTQMNEIAQMTYNRNDFAEIDKRLNNKVAVLSIEDPNQSLTVLDYLLHAGSENIFLYFRDNLYIIKLLKEFQYVDEDGKDNGAYVRQKAKNVFDLLGDPLQEERQARANMRDRMIGGNSRGRNHSADRAEELCNAIEASKKSSSNVLHSNNPFADPIPGPYATGLQPYATGLQPQQTFQPQYMMQPQFASFNPYQRQAQQLEEAMRAKYLRGQEWLRPNSNNPFSDPTQCATGLQPQQTNLELCITEDGDEDVAFVNASLSAARLSSASGVQNVASAALPSHHQQQERHDAPPSSIQVQAELDVSVLLQDLTKYITKVEDFPATRGGFGEIWRCTYSANQRPVPVAVKSLLVYASDQLMEKKTKRIQRELRICARLKHPNVLPVYGYTFGFGPFMAIVSPWAENGNLTAYMEREDTATLAVVRRFQILRDITAGLKYLHANNVIHGDLTGPNVLIHADGTACLADFGLSLLYSEVVSVTQASWTSSLHGNFRWLAPELLEPSDNDMPVLTNRSPYYYCFNEAAVIRCIYTGEKPNRSRYPALSGKYWDFIEECWSTATHDRPSTDKVAQVISDEFDSLSSFTNSS
ncbi:kinase-like protein [Rhizopogon salebrosus TDB-379]|nr:kinase-like protein [Rhizopogon salebrosus TDB-379]